MPVKSSTASLRLTLRGAIGAALVLTAAAFAAPGAGAAVPRYEGAAADGSVIFFTTTESLVNGDVDTRRDVYERSFDSNAGEDGAYVTREISTGPIGGNDAFDALFEGLSEDGTKAFFSTGERLVAADADHSGDIYVRDLENGTTSLVSVGAAACAPECGNGSGDSGFAATTGDGDEIFFVTTERMAPADEDDAVDVYERDLSEGSTALVSAGAAQCAPGCGNGSLTATLRGVSADGSRAFFATFESLSSADGDTAIDIYAHDIPSGPTELVTAGASACAPACGNGVADAVFAGSSADGDVVFFETSGGLVPGDIDNANDVYRRAGGATTMVSGGTETTPANVAQGNGSGRPAVSEDGTKILFTTAEGLVAGDKNAAGDVYRWAGGSPVLVTSGTCTQGEGCGSTFDAATSDTAKMLFSTTERLDPADIDSSVDIYESDISGGAPVLVSGGASGCAPGCGNGTVSAIFNGTSGDAAKVFFTSSEQLAPQDEDSNADIYLHDLLTSATTLGSPAGVCPNGLGCDVIFTGASSEGVHVVYQTEERLSPDDLDSEIDIYERAVGETRLVSTGNAIAVGPGPPVLTATNPSSPNASTNPAIIGQAEPLTAIKVYTTANCSGVPVATGSAAELGGSGIAVTVSPGTTTGFSATATDEDGDTSECSAAISYKQEDPPPPPPPPPPPTEGSGGTGGGSTGGGSGSKNGSKGKDGSGGTQYVAPETLITYGPAYKTRKRRPVFQFADATGQPGTGFFCKIDHGRWGSCGSPYKAKKLSRGKHAFLVKAINAVGVWEPRPVTRRFKVVR